MFADSSIKNTCLQLLQFTCPVTDCVYSADGWKSLKDHVSRIHKKGFCNICIQHRKGIFNFISKNYLAFTFEFKLYNQNELSRHKIKGDPDDLSFKGHPKCDFCSDFYYSKDELFTHLKQSHESCFVCKKMGVQDVYYQNYSSLEKHFRVEHIVCLEKECLERKFVVFENEIDFKDHQIQTHPEKLGKKGKGRVIDIQFNYSSRNEGSKEYSRPKVSQREQNHGGFDIPIDTTFNTNEISKKVPVGFGAQLSDSIKVKVESNNTRRNQENLKESSKESQNSQNTSSELLELSDLQVSENISILLNKNKTKYAQFNSIYDAFKSNVVSAEEFLTVFIDLCVSEVDYNFKKDVLRDLGKIWRRLADITLVESKKSKKKGIPLDLSGKNGNQEMLKAWNNYKIKNSNDVTPWESNSSFSAKARLLHEPTKSGPNILVLNSSELPSSTSRNFNSNWSCKTPAHKLEESNLEDFPSLPSSSKTFSVLQNKSNHGKEQEEIEWKKKGKKKVLMHFG